MINPFHATDLFWYPLKTSENQRFSDVFRGYQKRSVAWNGFEKIGFTENGVVNSKDIQRKLNCRSSRPEVFCKKVFLASFLIKLQGWALLKQRLWHRCFPVNFVKFLRTAFFIEHLWWLLLKLLSIETKSSSFLIVEVWTWWNLK